MVAPCLRFIQAARWKVHPDQKTTGCRQDRHQPFPTPELQWWHHREEHHRYSQGCSHDEAAQQVGGTLLLGVVRAFGVDNPVAKALDG